MSLIIATHDFCLTDIYSIPKYLVLLGKSFARKCLPLYSFTLDLGPVVGTLRQKLQEARE